jgi:simple sugar transport system ATP-binding protein
VDLHPGTDGTVTTDALALEGISKRFGTTEALRSASLTVHRGTVHALLGENGAGKTTMMRIAYGLIQPDQGTIRIAGNVVRLANPAAAIRAGLGMVHQHFTIVEAMTVAENVALGRSGRFEARAVAEEIRSLGASTGIDLEPARRAGTLGIAAQQQLEILKALAQKATVLILDEPTAVLAPAEAAHLMQRLRHLAERGLSVVLITHKLREALAVADHVTVLRQGATVLADPAADIAEGQLARAMLGSDWADTGESATLPRSRSSAEAGGNPRIVARAMNLVVRDERGVIRVQDASLAVHAHEAVGIAGVEGSGVHELLRAIARRVPFSAGQLDVPDRVGFVPEDRHREAVILDFSLTENVALRGAGTRGGRAHWRRTRERTSALLRDFDVRAAGPDAPLATLSGGNQQKLVLARELADGPPLLVVENPTRGLDLRAARAVRQRIHDARSLGAAVIVYSSDLDELIALSDRTYAMYAGTLVPTAADRDSIGRAMLGAGVDG